MDFKLAALLVALALVIGVVGGLAVAPEADVQVINLPGKEIIVDKEVEVLTTDTSLLLDQAVEDFMNEVSDDSDLRKCDGDKYSLSEISLESTDKNYVISIDDEDITVEFELELRYKESDLRSCYETFNAEAYYEFGEDVEVSLD